MTFASNLNVNNVLVQFVEMCEILSLCVRHHEEMRQYSSHSCETVIAVWRAHLLDMQSLQGHKL